MSACTGRARHSQAVPQSQGLPWLKHGWPKSAPAVHFFVPSVHPPGLPLAAGTLSEHSLCALTGIDYAGGPAAWTVVGPVCGAGKPIWRALRLLLYKHSCSVWCHNSCCGGGLGALVEHGCSSACYSRRCLATPAACGPNCWHALGGSRAVASHAVTPAVSAGIAVVK